MAAVSPPMDRVFEQGSEDMRVGVVELNPDDPVQRDGREVADRRVGFVVDRLIGQQDIVIKALGKSLKKVRGLAGATELGDQRVGLVLDAAALIGEVLASTGHQTTAA